jgi:hypothetical protein
LSRQFSNLGNVFIGTLGNLTDAQDDALRNVFETLDRKFAELEKGRTTAVSASTPRVASATSAKLASYAQSASTQKGGNVTDASEDAGDSGSHGILDANLADGEDVQPGFAVRVDDGLMYAAKATDEAYRCDGIVVRGVGNGAYKYRSGGSTQCILTGSGGVGNTVYLSTVPGKVTTDPTESTGGTRVILQPIGKIEKLVKTAIGTTGLCRVSLTIQEPANTGP